MISVEDFGRSRVVQEEGFEWGSKGGRIDEVIDQERPVG